MAAAIKFRIPIKCSCGKKGFDFISWNGQFFESDHVTPCCADGKYEIVGEPQQYTDLKDKNGVDGYFGDIAKHNDGDYGVLKWNEKTFRVYFQWNDDQTSYPRYLGVDDFVYVGNVHENSELLTEKSHA